MLERGKISCNQTVWMLVTLVGATAIMFLPAIAASEGGRDAWMSPVLATFPGFYLILVIVALGRMFPGQNLFQYLKEILGPWLGMAVGMLYLFFLIHTNGVIIRESSQLMETMILPKTPEIVLNMIMVLLCALAIRGGLEVLARTVEFFFFPGLLIVFFIAILMTAPDMHLKNLSPMLENGFLPVLRASVDPVVWRGEVVIFAVFLPYLAKPANAGRCGYLAVFVIGIILTLDAVANTAVFGPMVETMTFPTFSLIRQISAASSLERLDVVMVVVWIMGMYGKIALFYYAAVLGTAQLAHLQDYRPLVWPMGVLLVALSAQTADNALELVEYIIKPFPYFAGIFEFLLPTALLLTALVKKKLKPVC